MSTATAPEPNIFETWRETQARIDARDGPEALRYWDYCSDLEVERRAAEAAIREEWLGSLSIADVESPDWEDRLCDFEDDLADTLDDSEAERAGRLRSRHFTPADPVEEENGEGWWQAIRNRKYPDLAIPFDAKLLDDLKSALRYIPWSSLAHGLRVGLGLYSTGWGTPAFEVWSEWGEKWCIPKVAADVLRKTLEEEWSRFAGEKRHSETITIDTILRHATTNGWKKSSTMPLSIGPSPEEIRDAQKHEFKDPGRYPADAIIRDLQGPIAETIDWVRGEMRRDDPVIAIAAALSLFASALGRRVLGPDDSKPALALVALAPSGGGKDRARECIINIMESWSSDLRVGVIQTAPFHRVQLEHVLMLGGGQLTLCLDEFGSTLKMWCDPKSSAAQGPMGISPAVRSLISCGRAVYSLTPLSGRNPILADKDISRAWRAGIFSPVLNVLGFTTQEAFISALSNNSLTDGLLGRFCVLLSDSAVPKLKSPRGAAPPEALVGWLRSLADIPLPPTTIPNPFEITVHEDGSFDAKPATSSERRIGWASGAQEHFLERCHALDEEASSAEAAGLAVPAALLRRTPGQIAALATVLAAGEADDLGDPGLGVRERHIDLALVISGWSARHLGARAQHGVPDSDFGRAYETALAAIKKAGPAGVHWSRIARLRAVLPHAERLFRHFQTDVEIHGTGRGGKHLTHRSHLKKP